MASMGRNIPRALPDHVLDVSFDAAQPVSPQRKERPLQFAAQRPDKDGVVQWRYVVENLPDGLNQTSGPMELTYQQTQSSTLLTSRPYRLTLPFLTTTATTPDPATTPFMVTTEVFGTRAMAIGTDLFCETSTTDPTVVARTYAPGSIINGLTAITMDNTATRYLAVLREGGPIQLLSNLGATPTVAATMHADTTQAYGLVQVPTSPGDPFDEPRLLLYAGGRIRLLRSFDVPTREPDDTYTNIPNYGYALGATRIGSHYNRGYTSDSTVRVVWVLPKSSTLTQHMLTRGAEQPGVLIHTALDGSNPQLLRTSLPFVTYAALVRGGMACSDGTRVVWHDGQAIHDLKRHDDRGYPSDVQLRIRGFYVNEPQLFVEVELQASPSGSANTQRWIEMYDFETDAWHVVSEVQTLSTTGACGVACATGSLPFSLETRFLHTYSDGAWRRKYEAGFGVDPYSFRIEGSGGTGNTQEYAAQGTWTSVAMDLPNLTGWPSHVTRITVAGDIDAGGTGAYMTVSAGNMQNIPFTSGLPDRSQPADLTSNVDAFYKLQLAISMYRDTSSTRYDFNALPIIIEGYTYTKPLDPSAFTYDDVR